MRFLTGVIVLPRFNFGLLIYQALLRMIVLSYGNTPAGKATARAKQEIKERQKQAPIKIN